MTSISHTSTAIRDCDQFVLLGDSVAATEKFFTTRVPRICKEQRGGSPTVKEGLFVLDEPLSPPSQSGYCTGNKRIRKANR